LTKLQVGNLGFEFWQRQDIFLVLKTSRPALGSTQPPVQWIMETSSLGESDQGMRFTTQLHLVQRLRRWSYNSTPPMCLPGNSGTIVPLWVYIVKSTALVSNYITTKNSELQLHLIQNVISGSYPFWTPNVLVILPQLNNQHLVWK
jgi:hypothetical protein